MKDKTILLAVTGSIAAYKAVALASQLHQLGAHVNVLMTREATHFIGPLSFASITHRPVATDVLALGADSEIEHVALAKSGNVMLIAPATANMIAKLAHGLADDAVSATALDAFTRMPILVAPAMETGMWENPATRDNVETLRQRGFLIVEPTSGYLASGAQGKGRMAEVDTLIAAVEVALGHQGDLASRRIIVTAGGTQEALDPVRVIANKSSGRMGLALARAARNRGAEVTLILGTTRFEPPDFVEVVQAVSAREMSDAVLDRSRGADALLMAAAIADFRPAQEADYKIKKETLTDLTLTLVKNPDILASVAVMSEMERPHVVVGFAAESGDLIVNAQKKLAAKKLDFVVANPVPETFGSEQIQATFVEANGARQFAPMAKEEMADRILDRVLELLNT
ncbi:MAG TPA: bifunctional phosphopantothenoylcysteine decarboxylase/phosphopantothenate--cysteine ligase CoaBC [Anaerolineae bacterium]